MKDLLNTFDLFFLNGLLLQLDLQYFADDTNGSDQNDPGDTNGSDQNNPGGDANEPGQNDDKPGEKQGEKTFSQQDVNNLIARETKAATEKLLKSLGLTDFENAKDGISKFKEWQESQLTETEKQANALKEATSTLETVKGEKESLEMQLAILKNEGNPEFLEDIALLASKYINDETPKEQAVKTVLEKYPQFKKEVQSAAQGEKPSFLGKGDKPPETEKSVFAAKLAQLKKQ